MNAGRSRMSLAGRLLNYRKGINKGLLKILSKMGISTVGAYRGAQLFEVVGNARRSGRARALRRRQPCRVRPLVGTRSRPKNCVWPSAAISPIAQGGLPEVCPR